jgi:hypothetical protein
LSRGIGPAILVSTGKIILYGLNNLRGAQQLITQADVWKAYSGK